MTGSKIWDRSTRAFVSWVADVASCALITALFAAWIHDLQQVGEARFLSPSFLNQGFCVSNVVNTHTLCARFDFVGGLLLLALANSSATTARAMPCLGGAAYMFIHGYGHYWISGIESFDEIKQTLQEKLLLSLILAVGPMKAADTIEKSGFAFGTTTKTNLRVGVAIVVFCLTGFYEMVVKEAKYGLLYINITIILISALPRAIFIGYTKESDITLRVDLRHWFWSQISKVLVNLLVVLEPLSCDIFVRQLGGHLLFDAVIFISLVVFIMNDGKS